jgi:hypothetical protein
MVKKMTKQSKFLLGSLLLSINELFSQKPNIGKVEQTVQAGGDSLIRIFTIVGRVCYSAIGAFLIFKLIMVIVGSDRGEDKVMKIGGLAVVIILGSIVVMMAEGVFS